MTNYVVGFLHDGDSVVLVEKNRPEWQAGKLNGIGGHIELGETPKEAMVREFKEETGMDTFGWRNFLTLESGEHTIVFFEMKVLYGFLRQAKTMEDEEVDIYGLHMVRDCAFYEIIPNLSWILPLAMYSHDEYKPILVKECG